MFIKLFFTLLFAHFINLLLFDFCSTCMFGNLFSYLTATCSQLELQNPNTTGRAGVLRAHSCVSNNENQTARYICATPQIIFRSNACSLQRSLPSNVRSLALTHALPSRSPTPFLLLRTIHIALHDVADALSLSVALFVYICCCVDPIPKKRKTH